jgi:hypothetical protein
VVKRKKIVYLQSYDGSSVGIMQINERVWRGIYDLQHLRWDIRYNTVAGCEILDLYVTKYLAGHAKRFEAIQKLTDETRAELIYAMYNGGPGQLEKFLNRSARGKFYDSDKLYLEIVYLDEKRAIGEYQQMFDWPITLFGLGRAGHKVGKWKRLKGSGDLWYVIGMLRMARRGVA